MLDGKAKLHAEKGRYAQHSTAVDQIQAFSMYKDFSNTAKTMKKCVHTPDCSDDVIASATVTDKLITGLDYVAVTHIEEELVQISELPILHFHEKKITLSNDELTTERMDRGALDGVVVSRDTMIVNRLIETTEPPTGLSPHQNNPLPVYPPDNRTTHCLSPHQNHPLPVSPPDNRSTHCLSPHQTTGLPTGLSPHQAQNHPLPVSPPDNRTTHWPVSPPDNRTTHCLSPHQTTGLPTGLSPHQRQNHPLPVSPPDNRITHWPVSPPDNRTTHCLSPHQNHPLPVSPPEPPTGLSPHETTEPPTACLPTRTTHWLVSPPDNRTTYCLSPHQNHALACLPT
ncbi:hypothetical protein ACOMHN_036145 [Nucella lapillus]